MARGTIEHDEQVMIGVGFGELIEESLQAPTVHPGQIKAEALSRDGVERRIQVGPLLSAPDDVGWAKPFGTVAPSVPVDQAKTRFVEGQNLQRSATVMVAASPDGGGEVFLKAFCS